MSAREETRRKKAKKRRRRFRKHGVYFSDDMLRMKRPRRKEIFRAEYVLREQFPYFHAFRTGTRDERVAARNILIELNKGLVGLVATREPWRTLASSGRNLDRMIAHDDLMQHGIVALVRAIEKFDYTRGVRFSTYALHWVEQEFRHRVRSVAGIYLPSNVWDKIARYRRVYDRLERELGRSPCDAELREALALSEKAYAILSHATAVYRAGMRVLAHDGAMPDGDPYETEVWDRLLRGAGPDEAAHDAHREAVLDSGIVAAVESQSVLRFIEKTRLLSAREREIIIARTGLDGRSPQTLQAVGDRLGISRERVRQVEAQALGKLRKVKFLQELYGTPRQ